MQKSAATLAAFLVLMAAVSGQSTTRPKYLEHAIVEHRGEQVIVTASFPIPLFQAIAAIREEYGWQVNWEEAPCYSHFEVVDDTGPTWRAAHPYAKGVTRRAGGAS